MPEPRDMHDLIDAYVDGTLPDDQRAAFDAELEQSPPLRAEVELQRRIDERLTRIFNPEHVDVDLTDNPAPPAVARRVGRGPIYGLIAAVIVVAIGGIALYPKLIASRQTKRQITTRFTRIGPAEQYQRLAESGFKVDWRCETDEQFKEVTLEHLARPLLVADSPAVEVAGWKYIRGYERVLSSGALILLSKVDGEDVVVIMDQASRDESLSIPPDSGLNLFRRQLEDVVLYEITPRTEPAILDLVFVPEDG